MKTRILVPFLAAAGLFAAERSPDARLRHATEAFQDVMKSPDKGIPRDLFNKAQCAVIVPDLLKGAFFVGGKYGRGFASCRQGSGWSSPAAVRIEGGSFGLQLGGSSTDLIMLVMNRKGMDRLLGDKFTLGADVEGAAGPVGRETSAQTDAVLHAEILTWSRARGLFGGISLEGATLRPDGSENRKLYGREISNREILETGVRAPAGGRPFVAMLDRYSNKGETSNHGEVSKELSERGSVILSDKQVHFATGQSTIPGDAEPVLSDIAKTVKDHPDWKIRIDGFTDNVGNWAFNIKLSHDRAEAVKHWLEDHGVEHSRLSVKGYGGSRPVGDNGTEEGRAQNRRVELVRVDYKS